MVKSKDLLIEIGTEEMPSSLLEPAIQGFKEKVIDFLSQNRINFEKVKTYYTPRRLAVLVQKVADQQKRGVIEVAGPPWRNAFDQNGNPLRSAHAFAKSQGKSVHDLYPKKTDRGEYVFVKKETPQEKTQTLFIKKLPEIIQTIPFSKTMRWLDSKIRFGRPIRWLCAMYGSKPLIFKIDGIVSAPRTFGHFNFSRNHIKLKSASAYEKTLQNYGVIPNPLSRKRDVEKKLNRLAQKVNGVVVKDENLLSDIVNTIEYPYPILCQFKSDFLSLPAVILITALKSHQHCFSIQNKAGHLRPFFITVANNPKCNQEKVKTWYEKAVESRLNDAMFYLKEDLKNGFSLLNEKQKEVIWIEELGSLFDKTQRLVELAKFITQNVPEIEKEMFIRAAGLAKLDLLTNMVREKEFTSLQGTIGGIYVEASGEPPPVAKAIREHYLPRNLNDTLPKSKEGALLSIIDKIDYIVASFIIGAIPSGSEDPFALRRQASAIFSIILDKGFFLDLNGLISYDIKLFEQASYPVIARCNLNETLKKIRQFLKERLISLLLDRKIRYDAVNAVIETFWVNPVDAWHRITALEKFRSGKNFENLVIGQKRVVNILKGQDMVIPIKENLLTEKEEIELLNNAKQVENPLNEAIKKQDYTQALTLLLSLRQSIDILFDNVLVMTGDINLRHNRLALLDYIKSLFMKVADLSQIVLEGE